MKGFGVLLIAVCLITAVSCSNENPMEDYCAQTRGVVASDSTKQGSLGMATTINDEWEGDTVIHY